MAKAKRGTPHPLERQGLGALKAVLFTFVSPSLSQVALLSNPL